MLRKVSDKIRIIVGYLKFKYIKEVELGKNVFWRRGLHIIFDKGAKISIGDNTFFNYGCSINGLGNVIIGENCLFGENVKLYDHNHKFNKKGIPLAEQGFSIGEIKIGNNCWLGSNVVVLKGTNIGDNCVIGAGCVVSGNIPSETILKNTSDGIKKEKIVYG